MSETTERRVAVYRDYGPDRVGFFFGLTGWQLVVIVAAFLPVLAAINGQRWLLAGELTGIGVLIVALVTIPVRGRSATGWLNASLRFAVGKACLLYTSRCV